MAVEEDFVGKILTVNFFLQLSFYFKPKSDQAVAENQSQSPQEFSPHLWTFGEVV
jgi:hypothetical protein